MVNSGAPVGLAVPDPHVTPVVLLLCDKTAVLLLTVFCVHNYIECNGLGKYFVYC
jgi:hypothetical protein